MICLTIVIILYKYLLLFFSSGTLGTSPSPSEGFLSSTPQSLPTFHHPSHALLMENNFTQQAYHKYHSRCLKGVYNNNNNIYKYSFIEFYFKQDKKII